MSCVFMKVSFWFIDEYEESMGRPRRCAGRAGSSSEGRIMRRGGVDLSGMSRRYGTSVRERRRARYVFGYTCVWISTIGVGAMMKREADSWDREDGSPYLLGRIRHRDRSDMA